MSEEAENPRFFTTGGRRTCMEKKRAATHINFLSSSQALILMTSMLPWVMGWLRLLAASTSTKWSKKPFSPSRIGAMVMKFREFGSDVKYGIGIESIQPRTSEPNRYICQASKKFRVNSYTYIHTFPAAAPPVQWPFEKRNGNGGKKKKSTSSQVPSVLEQTEMMERL